METSGFRRTLVEGSAIMYPFAYPAGSTLGRTPVADDIAGVSALYPEGRFTSSTGSISGRVTKDGRDVFGAYVNALEVASGVAPVTIGKPAPSFFRAGIEALGGDPSAIAMVGDDLDNDVLGAQAVGLTGVLVRTGKFRAEELAASIARPDHVVDTFADVPALVG